MGKGKAVVIHLLAIAAGWGIIAALRPVVGSWLGGGEEAAAESRAPSKTGRVRSTAEIAAGQKILQRYTDSRLKYPPLSPPGPERSFEEFVDEFHRVSRFDPAAKAPSRDSWNRPSAEVAATEYYQLLDRMLSTHLNGEHGPDLAHAFRQGRLDAVALYDSLAAHLPGPAADDTLRRALYEQVAPLDPDRAAALLEPLSADAAIGVKYEAFKHQRGAYAPDAAFSLLASIPPPANPSAMIPRQSAWLNATPDFLSTYGSDYLHWVEGLPAGSDRNLAAVALMVRLRENDLPGYRRMRDLVTEPGMLRAFPPR